MVGSFVQALERGDRDAACDQLRVQLLIEWDRVFNGSCAHSANAPDPAWFEDWEIKYLTLDGRQGWGKPYGELAGRFNLGRITFQLDSRHGRWYILDLENFDLTAGSPPA